MLDRSFVGEGRLLNRWLLSGLLRQTRHEGKPLDAFRRRNDSRRRQRQAELFDYLNDAARNGSWPSAPLAEMARYVVDGRDRRSAQAALAFVITRPFLGPASADAGDDVFKPLGRRLWRLHRRTEPARRPLSLSALAYRLLRIDRRARAAILELVHDEPYGLHAVEITLANANDILQRMRRVMADRSPGAPHSARELAWAAIRTAPEVVVRQSTGEETTLPHVPARVPPHTIVLLRMRQGLRPDAASGYEFASAHWSACPARRYVMGLFEAVARAGVELAAKEAQRP